jgi:hypothetical protein
VAVCSRCKGRAVIYERRLHSHTPSKDRRSQDSSWASPL